MAHPGGRPDEYKPEYVSKVDEYLALRKDKIFKWVKTDGVKSTTRERRVKVQLPTVEDFAMFIGVSKRSLYTWEKDHVELMHALDKIREEQRKRLLNMGLSGDYNPVIAKLILSSNHGYKERNDVTTDDKEIKVVPILGGKSNVSSNDSDKQDTGAEQED